MSEQEFWNLLHHSIFYLLHAHKLVGAGRNNKYIMSMSDADLVHSRHSVNIK